jgi:hypothetical protein
LVVPHSRGVHLLFWHRNAISNASARTGEITQTGVCPDVAQRRS